MPEKLKPCPACGTPGDTLEVYPVKDGFYQVGCWDCFMRGTRLLSPDKAIKAWNALPRRLRWTMETPKEPGIYWYRDKVRRDPIVVTYDPIKNYAREGHLGHPLDKLAAEYKPIEWAGPIPEPEE